MGAQIRNSIFNLPEGFSSGGSYWTPKRIAAMFLFYGETLKISGGRLNNQVLGSSDYLTVGGSAGSETYQTPNNDTYKTADTDYIWFNHSADQITVTTAQLIGYDLQRTPVKYLDDSPNTISVIGILKTGVVLTGTARNKVFELFELPVFWDDSLNAYGHVKSNRIGQQLWSPFVMTFDTELAGSATKTVVIPTYSNGYDCVVDWGDGNADSYIGGTLNTAGTITHVYATAGIKTVSISGVFPQIYFNIGGDCFKLKTIDRWGTGVWRSMYQAFFGCANMIGTYTDSPNISAVYSMFNMFRSCTLFNSRVDFNLTPLAAIAYMFCNALAFDQDVSSFNIADISDFENAFLNVTFSTANYDALLISWSAQAVKPNVVINFGTSKYTAGGVAAAARDHLVTVHGWAITDGGTL